MSHICPCPNPPGGQIVCREDQLAICGFRDGKIVSGCFDKPSSADTVKDEEEKNLIVANWSLSMITGLYRGTRQPLDNDAIEVLQSGRYRHEPTGEMIHFALPNDLDLTRVEVSTPLVYSR